MAAEGDVSGSSRQHHMVWRAARDDIGRYLQRHNYVLRQEFDSDLLNKWYHCLVWIVLHNNSSLAI